MSSVTIPAKAAALLLTLAMLAVSCSEPDGAAPGARSPSPTGEVASPLDAEGAGAFEERTLRFRGENRNYGLYLPEAMPAGPSPLVAFLHGPAERGIGLVEELKASGLAPVADQEGFLVVLPTSVSGAWRVGHDAAENEAETEWLAAFGRDSFAAAGWNYGNEDADFIMAVVDEVASTYNVDFAKVYSAGKQNGAFMAARMVCDHAERFAAVAVMAGGLRLSEPCAATRPVAAFTTIGSLQTTISPELGERGAAEWAQRNGCDPAPTASQETVDVSELRYEGCQASAEVVLHVVEGVGFLWPWPPQGSTQIEGYHPGTAMWTFLSQHELS